MRGGEVLGLARLALWPPTMFPELDMMILMWLDGFVIVLCCR